MAKTALEQHTAHFHAKAAKQMSKLEGSNWKPTSLTVYNPESLQAWLADNHNSTTVRASG